MEEEIKIIEELKKFLSEDITPQFSVEESARALEHLLQAYKEDEAVIEEMAEYIGRDIRCIRPEIECNKMTHDCEKRVKEYFRKKVKGEKE